MKLLVYAQASVYLLLILACTSNQNEIPLAGKDKALFQRISSASTGIEFNNTIQEDIATKANLFDFDYFYNGAGVGIADLNNDNLPDIFFAGNQVSNKLYINKGNLQFEDISLSANINQNKNWSNGVTFADVNKDGWLDIYVSQGGPFEAAQRKNLLYINQGANTASEDGYPVFVESAEDYGLADQGLSTQSAFFDCDKDGDLDCIVVNENELYGTDPIKFFQITETNPEIKYNSSCHFYRNDSDGSKVIFTDITKEAGVLKPMFGLGLIVSDINGDGWLDMYVASDYYLPDALFINNKNGGFTDQIKSQTKQISFYGMGADVADINNDGLQDIFVLDMASSDHYRAKTLMASMNVSNFDLLVNTFEFPYQYMFNSLQLNLGNGAYNNVAHLTGMAKTDWSWAVLMSDFDNDQNRDIFITNGYRRYALDNDIQNKVRAAQAEYKGNVPLEVKKKLYYEMPTEKLSNQMFFNNTNLNFKEVTEEWGLNDPSYSNGAAVADLDRDGDLDLVVNNIDEEAFVYRNNSIETTGHNYLQVETQSSTSESFAKVTVKYQGQTQIAENKRVRGYMSACEDIVHFGLKDVSIVDSVIVEWLNGESEIRTGRKS